MTDRKMMHDILKRLLLLPFSLLLLSVLIFVLMMWLPPDKRLPIFISNADNRPPRGSVDELVVLYGLDQPFYLQYYTWLGNILRGNLGWSFSAGMPVSKALSRYFPVTLELMLVSAFIVFPGGIFLGTYAVTHYNRSNDQAVRLMSIIGVSLPPYIFGLLLLIFFYAGRGWFPSGRLSIWAENITSLSSFKRYTGMILFDSLFNGRIDIFSDAVKHLVLPGLTYSLGLLSTVFPMIHSSLLETLNQDYIMTARAKGLLEKVVIKKHARRNALLPVIMRSGMLAATMLGGAIIVETVFAYRGMGMFLVTAAQALDLATMLCVSLFIGFIIILTNLVFDILYMIFDPRELRVE